MSQRVATLGHPADGVVVNQSTTTTTTSSSTSGAPHHHHHHGHHAQQQGGGVGGPVHTQAGQNNADGLAVASNLGSSLAGAVVLGGQCECTQNGGVCKHGAGQCMCRGCTTAATSLNPGINIGVSTHQYTAPVGTTGLGGGVSEAGTGMAGVVNPTNTVGAPVQSAVQNCECVRTAGVCNCAPGQCACTNCAAQRRSTQATKAGSSSSTATPLGGSEYVGSGTTPAYTSSTTTSSTTRTTNDGVKSPLTDNSDVAYTNTDVPYTKKDYTQGTPVSGSGVH